MIELITITAFVTGALIGAAIGGYSIHHYLTTKGHNKRKQGSAPKATRPKTSPPTE